MRNFTLLLIFIASALGSQGQGNTVEVQGSVGGDNGETIGYATAVILNPDSSQLAATVSDANGLFSMQVPPGRHIFKIGCLGYADHFEQINVVAPLKMPLIKLVATSVEVGAVSVTARHIVREADRFVMNVAGTAEAIGNTAFDMLSKAPGVWVNNETISINGFSGSQVIVGERILDMPFDELKVYLASIKADDIQKIEVIPVTGADFDANAKGGVIKITLRSQRKDGIDGNVAIVYQTDRMGGYDVAPSATINYRRNKLSLYINGTYSDERKGLWSNGENRYADSPKAIDYNSSVRSNGEFYRIKTGMIYDFTDRKSFGAEVSYSQSSDADITKSLSSILEGSEKTQMDVSSYNGYSDRSSIYATVNYIYKIDTTGKVLKFIADYSRRNGNTFTRYENSIIRPSQSPYDSLYRDSNGNNYNIFSLNANLELPLNKRISIKAGAKFNLNNMASSQLYEGFYPLEQQWLRNDVNSLENKYNEYIAALYAIVNTKFFDKLSLSAGLRAEYTYAKPQTELIGVAGSEVMAKQSYFKLFPNVSLTMPFDPKSNHMLTLSYRKTISRPGFWAITPFRRQLSEYSYIEGNPALQPTIQHGINLTYIIAQKYSLSLGMQKEKNTISQLSRVDEQNRQVIATRFENLTGDNQYFVSINAPVTITKWWSANINMVGMRQQITNEGLVRSNNLLMSNVSTTITLPAKFVFEMSGYYMTKMIWGNMTMDPMLFFNAAVKKRIAKDKVTMSVEVENIFDKMSNTNATIVEPSFSQNIGVLGQFRTVKVSLRYNFNSGMKFKAKQVEQGNEDSEQRAGK